MIGSVHGFNLWQTTYSFSPSSASIMPTEVCEALDKYQPEYVVVWGKRLWDKMPGERWQDGEPIVVDGSSTATGAYLLNNGRRVKAMAVNHPSVGYSWDYWYRVLGKFFLH